MPIYTPVNGAPGFAFLHILALSFVFFRMATLTCVEDISLWLWYTVSDDSRYWVSFPVPVSHLCLLWKKKCLFTSSAHFFFVEMFGFLLSCRSSLCVLNSNPLMDILCKHFLPRRFLLSDAIVRLLCWFLFKNSLVGHRNAICISALHPATLMNSVISSSGFWWNRQDFLCTVSHHLQIVTVFLLF